MGRELREAGLQYGDSISHVGNQIFQKLEKRIERSLKATRRNVSS